MAKTQHPFSSRKGRAFRDDTASKLWRQQGGKCKMCNAPVPATLRGRTGKRAAVLDHIRPHSLRPDLTWDTSNLQLICRACHAKCESIEAAHKSDADMIAEVKAREGQEW